MKRQHIKLKNTPQVKKYNQALRRASKNKMNKRKKTGIDWSKKDMYEGIGRPDLKPRENKMKKLKKDLREDITHLVRRAVERSLLVGKEPAIANYSKNLIDLFNQALKQQRKEILAAGYDEQSKTYSPDAIFDYLKKMIKTKKELREEFDKKWKTVRYSEKKSEYLFLGKFQTRNEIGNALWSWIEKALQEAREEGWQTGHKQTKEDYQAKEEEVIERMIKLSDEIESGKETTFEEWKGFKHFRNAMRDTLDSLKKGETK